MALPMMLEHLDPVYHLSIKTMLIETIQAITPLQQDHLFRTILNHRSGLESSANFLIHGGILKTVRLGIMDDAFGMTAQKGYEASMKAFIQTKENHPYLTKVSNPTIPLPLFPKLGYKWIGYKDNWSYGLASLIFASIAYNKRMEL